MLSNLRLSLFTLAVLTAPARAQGDDLEPPLAALTDNRLLVMLRSRSCSYDRAAAIVEVLATRAVRPRLAARKVLDDHLARQRRNSTKALERHVADLCREAARDQRRRLGRTELAEIDTLRTAALAHSRSPDLDKATIHDQIDPAVHRLEELLLPRRAALLEQQRDLDEQLEELRIAHAVQRDWHSLVAQLADGLARDAKDDKQLANKPPLPPTDAELDRHLDDALFRSLVEDAQDQGALAANADLRAQVPEQEFLGTADLNRRRFLLGLRLLRIDTRLADAARDHSKDMHTLGFFSHTSPIEGKRTFGQRAAKFATSASAENIASGQSTGHGAIRAWWYSPGHHRNMLGGHRRTGLGRHEQLWTQLFGG